MQPGWATAMPSPTPTFSILNRIGGDATSGRCSHQCRVLALSVSSIGSEAMQPPSAARSGKLRVFSFSILNRIGGDATLLGRGDFIAVAELSVSSIGSEAMQLLQVAARAFVNLPFSILNRIGGDATLLVRHPARVGVKLSVSSIGSEAMQRPMRKFKGGWIQLSVSSIGSEAMQRSIPDERIKHICRFQYPQSDRRRCNPTPTYRPSAVCQLSVSSIGSEAMQRAPGCPLRLPPQDFQYPQSDRRRCNYLRHPQRAGIGRAFQYPQSDRRRCNTAIPDAGVLTVPTFSILNRIGGDATLAGRSAAGPGDPPLSVSSIGSEAMQPSLRLTSCGCWWTSFSILNRIGGDATPWVRRA